MPDMSAELPQAPMPEATDAQPATAVDSSSIPSSDQLQNPSRFGWIKRFVKPVAALSTSMTIAAGAGAPTPVAASTESAPNAAYTQTGSMPDYDGLILKINEQSSPSPMPAPTDLAISGNGDTDAGPDTGGGGASANAGGDYLTVTERNEMGPDGRPVWAINLPKKHPSLRRTN